MIRDNSKEIKLGLNQITKKIGKIQSRILLTIFYYTIVAVTFLYLKISKNNQLETTGYFRETSENQKKLKDYKKQF